MSTSHRIGQRISYDGALCTVRFIGEVAGTTGTWLGVEWDDSARGKHDGCHKGVRYFTCKMKHSTSNRLILPAFALTKTDGLSQANLNSPPLLHLCVLLDRLTRRVTSWQPSTTNMPANTRFQTEGGQQRRSYSSGSVLRRLGLRRSARCKPILARLVW